MPADTGVDNRGTRCFNRFRQSHRFIPTVTVGNQIDHRQTINNDEVLANGLASSRNNLHSQAHAVRKIASPFVCSMVGRANEELVNEITFRPHYFNAVIARLSRELGTANKRLDLFFHARR